MESMTSSQWVAKVKELESRLKEARETLEAIRSGGVDAVVVQGSGGPQVYALAGADQPYRMMVEDMHEGALTMSAHDGVILYCNRQCASMLRMTADGLLGRSFREFLTAGSLATFEALLRNGVRESSRGEAYLTASDGTRVPVQLSFRVFQADGPDVVSVVVSDLTQQRRHEEILAAKSLSESILDQAADAMVVCDHDAVIFRANQAAQKLCGENPLFRSFQSAFPLQLPTERTPECGAIRSPLDQMPLAFSSSMTIRAVEAILPAADTGVCRHLLVSRRPLLGLDEKVIGWIMTMVDITDRKRAEDETLRNREWLRVTLASIGDAVVATDTEGRITLMNGGASKLTAWDPEQALGRPIGSVVKIIDEDTRQPAADIVAHVLKDKKVIAAPDHRALISRDGREFLIEASAAPIVDASGHLMGVVLVFYDTTEKRHARKALEDAEERLRLAVTQAGMATWDTDMSTGKSVWSENCFKLLGYEPIPSGQATHEMWESRIHPDDRDQVANARKAAIEGDGPFASEYRIIRADDQQVAWIRSFGRFLYDDNGAARRFVGILFDNTAIHAAANEIAVAKEQAEAANRAKSEFLAAMSHEIRTPLNAIIGFSEILASGDVPIDKRGDYAGRIRRSGQVLVRLIDDILDLSKIEAGKVEIEKVEVNFPQLISDVRAIMQGMADEKGLAFSVKVEPPLPQNIISDPTRLKQILSNIIGNAIKFTSAGSVTAQVRVNDREGAIQVLVRDTGVGLRPEQISRLFQPFVQADASTTRKHGGTGLGLVLARRLAEALGGGVKFVESEPGVGSVVEIKVKLEGAKYEVASVVSPKNSGEVELPLDGISVLLAEDSRENRILAKRILTLRGARVDVARDGQEAVEKASSTAYDIILMDLQMPKVDGYEATARLRGQGFKGPIVAFTASAMREESERSHKAGCDWFLTKPIPMQELVETVRRFAVSGG